VSFSWDAKARVQETQTELRQLAAAAVRHAGGAAWLAAALDREPSYETKINDALAARDERRIQLDWLAPLLDDLIASEMIVSWLCARCGFEPPVRKRTTTPEQEGQAARAVFARLPESIKSGLRAEMARELGVRVEDLKL
jgi:hypothetical protein